MYWSKAIYSFFLTVLLCCACVFYCIAVCFLDTMGSFTIPINQSNYDIKCELDLPNCDYLLPGNDNNDLLSSASTDLIIMQLNIRGLLNKKDSLKNS